MDLQWAFLILLAVCAFWLQLIAGNVRDLRKTAQRLCWITEGKPKDKELSDY